MKILVDKMPETPEKCDYSMRRTNGNGVSWIGCSLRTIACKDTNKCPVFTDCSLQNVEVDN